jgi:hypothetical protein
VLFLCWETLFLFSENKLAMDIAQQNEMTATRWFAAFNEHDLEKLLALYDDHARHFSPKLKIRQPATNGYIVG